MALASGDRLTPSESNSALMNVVQQSSWLGHSNYVQFRAD